MLLEQRAYQIEEKFEELLPLLGDKQNEVLEGLQSCTNQERLVMKWLYTTMPLSDIACYTFDVFLDYARHGLFLWTVQEVEVPEDLFLNYVLHPRINEEEITPCRSFFYHQLKERLQDKTPKECILEVNYWCSEQATYQSTDERTVAPLTVYQSAYGRCGEESTFTVSALRSVGIPARQVYAPRWSHCDDNHAWVEVWCEGEWYFLGACEPEEILNKGWFTSASSRAMLIHSRWFDFIAPKGEEVIEKRGMVTLLNQLHRYAITKQLKVKVVNKDAEAVVGARVDFEVLNDAQFYPIASAWTDENGEVSLNTGLGSLHLHISKALEETDLLINTRDVAYIQVDLSEHPENYKWIELEAIAPLDAPIHTCTLTDSQKIKGKSRSMLATMKRIQKVEGFKNKDKYLEQARGNIEEILYFKTQKVNKQGEKWKDQMLQVLSTKDYRDSKGEVLIEHLNYALPYAELYPEDIFAQYILNPRIIHEPITAYRKFIDHYYDEEEKIKMTQNPTYIWKKIDHSIITEMCYEYPHLITTPVGCLQVRRGSTLSKKVLFVAICRTLGIPARLRQLDYEIEYYQAGAFHTLSERDVKQAVLTLKSKGEIWDYFKNWSIAKLCEKQYKVLNLKQLQWKEQELVLNLEEGTYRLLTANRLPNGNAFTKVMYIQLKAGEKQVIDLELKQAKLEDMLEHISLQTFSVKDLRENEKTSIELMQAGKRLWMWLEEGKEPTEHILNEMYEQRELFKKIEHQVVLMIKEPKALENPTLKKVLNAFEGIVVYYDDFEENVESLARRMYVDPDKLPFMMITNERNDGIYATSGYNVGSIDLVLRILKVKK